MIGRSVILALVASMPISGCAGEMSDTALQGDGMLMAGMMTYMADAAVFEVCQGDAVYPIAAEGDYLALEQGYLADRAAPGTALYVEIDGAIDTRPAMEGPERDTVIVDRFIRTRPGITCERQMADASLTDTYWRIDMIDGAAVPINDGGREAHLILSGEDAVVYRATVGCNQIGGTVSWGDGSLRFGPGRMTMMACPEPLGRAERQLVKALSETVSSSIQGETLVLRDEGGAPRVVLTAIAF